MILYFTSGKCFSWANNLNILIARIILFSLGTALFYFSGKQTHFGKDRKACVCVCDVKDREVGRGVQACINGRTFLPTQQKLQQLLFWDINNSRTERWLQNDVKSEWAAIRFEIGFVHPKLLLLACCHKYWCPSLFANFVLKTKKGFTPTFHKFGHYKCLKTSIGWVYNK